MSAASTSTKLGTINFQNFDTCIAELPVRVLVLGVSHDDAGLKRDDVVSVVPLFALGLILVSPCRHDS